MAQSTSGAFIYNNPKVLNASHVIALCMRTDLDEAHLQNVLAQEEKDGRFAKPEAKAGQDKSRRSYVDMHRYELRDVPQWMEKQVYLALGGLLLGAAMLGIDATRWKALMRAHLTGRWACVNRVLPAWCWFRGYRSEEDFNATLPKSRLPQDEIFTFI